MAHHTLVAGAPAVLLPPGMELRLEAINPTTDAEVAGVTCTRWSIYGDDEGTGPPLVGEVPRWTPEEAGELV